MDGDRGPVLTARRGLPFLQLNLPQGGKDGICLVDAGLHSPCKPLNFVAPGSTFRRIESGRIGCRHHAEAHVGCTPVVVLLIGSQNATDGQRPTEVSTSRMWIT